MKSTEEEDFINPCIKEDKTDFIQKNMSLVRYIVKKHYTADFIQKKLGNLGDSEDLLAYGSIGLVKAYKKFDPSKFEGGVKFSTYAYPLIKGEIDRFLRDSNPGVKVSRITKEDYMDIYKAGLLSMEPEYISEKMGLSLKRVKLAVGCANIHMSSMDAELRQDSDGSPVTLADKIAEESPVSNDDRLIIQDFLGSLPEELREITIKYYLGGYTQVEIAEQLNLSQVMVSRKLSKIKEIMKDYSSYRKRGGYSMSSTKKYSKSGVEARKLLLDTNKSISEISRLTGLSKSTVWLHSKELRPDSIVEGELGKEITSDNIQLTTSVKKQELPSKEESKIEPKEVIQQKTEQIEGVKTSNENPSSIILDRNLVDEILEGKPQKLSDREVVMVLDVAHIPIDQAQKELNRYACALKFMGVTHLSIRLEATEDDIIEY